MIRIMEKCVLQGALSAYPKMHWNEELYDRRSSNCGDAGE